MVRIIKAGPEHLDQVSPLFDGYRVFYKQDSDLEGGRKFLSELIEKGDSVIYLAYWDQTPVGFTQLFPSYSSVSMQPLFILNDLYVLREFRGKGIASALLDQAKSLCMDLGFKGLALETAIDNPARELYERLGWKKDVACFHYFWSPE